MTGPKMPTHAMILAAGLGTRMRPLTDGTAKALLQLQGRALLDHALDRLAAAGVRQVVVNAHWQAKAVADHLAGRVNGPAVRVLDEAKLLDTGGAVATALARGWLGKTPFYVVNGDAFWLDGPIPILDRLAGAMTAETEADGVLAFHRGAHVVGEVGAGDFALDRWGIPRRPHEREIVPYVFAGLQILAPRLFQEAPPPPFSMNRLWDRAMGNERLRGVVHDGLWFHLSTPPDLAWAENRLRDHVSGEPR
jgi:N-acetyl-alpha-D-muramate 1-phosphate uridylyltransferase